MLTTLPENVYALAVLFGHRLNIPVGKDNKALLGVLEIFRRYARDQGVVPMDDAWLKALGDHMTAEATSRHGPIQRKDNLDPIRLCLGQARRDLDDDGKRAQAIALAGVLVSEGDDETMDAIATYDKISSIVEPGYKRPRVVQKVLNLRKQRRQANKAKRQRKKKGGGA